MVTRAWCARPGSQSLVVVAVCDGKGTSTAGHGERLVSDLSKVEDEYVARLAAAGYDPARHLDTLRAA
jgi:hypothetical protein